MAYQFIGDFMRICLVAFLLFLGEGRSGEVGG